jgi:putative endonuclease
MTSREIGDIGEEAVARFLKQNGYEILERNFTVRGGEIDIIAQKNGRLAFVEVKSRKSGSLTTGESAITAKKRGFIVRTADIYYRRYKAKYGTALCRFDVAVAEIDCGKVKHVKYYVSAFDASGA